MITLCAVICGADDRHIALNLLRGDPTRRVVLKNSRFKAALSDTYLLSIILGSRS